MALISVPTADPTHTLDMCESCSEVTSTTANPDDEKSTEGVSLNYTLPQTDNPLNLFHKAATEHNTQEIPTPTIDDILSPNYSQPANYKWFFLRVCYNRAEKLYESLKNQKKGFLLWMPCQKKITYKDGKKYENIEPIFKSNLFIYATYDQAFSLTHRAIDTGYSYVDFAYDHTLQNQYGRDLPMTVPFPDMLRFIKAEQIHHPWAHAIPEEKIHFKPGGIVRVTGGAFEGVEGRVARVYGQTRVVITIKGIINYATAFVSSKYLVPIEENPKPDLAVHSPANRLQESRKQAAKKMRKRHHPRNHP